MAVTQQLAKLSEEQLNKCMSSIPVIEMLIDFTLLPKEGYLDLNWEGTFILKLFEQNDNKHKKILAGALDGLHAISDEELDVYEQPRYLSFDEVRLVNEAIREIDFSEVLSCLPDNLADINNLLKSDYEGNPEKTLLAAWEKLAGFYSDAAEHGSCVMCWWD